LEKRVTFFKKAMFPLKLEVNRNYKTLLHSPFAYSSHIQKHLQQAQYTTNDNARQENGNNMILENEESSKRSNTGRQQLLTVDKENPPWGLYVVCVVVVIAIIDISWKTWIIYHFAEETLASIIWIAEHNTSIASRLGTPIEGKIWKNDLIKINPQSDHILLDFPIQGPEARGKAIIEIFNKGYTEWKMLSLQIMTFDKEDNISKKKIDRRINKQIHHIDLDIELQKYKLYKEQQEQKQQQQQKTNT